MSGAVAYASVAAVLWLAWRLRVFESDGSPADAFAVGALSGAAGLLYSLAPLLLGFGVLQVGPRTSLPRFCAWAAGLLVVTVAWGQLAGGRLLIPVALLLAGITAVGLVSAYRRGAMAPVAGWLRPGRLTRRLHPRLIGLSCIAIVAGTGVLLGATSEGQAARSLALRGISHVVQAPEWVTPHLDQYVGTMAQRYTSSMREHVHTIVQTLFGDNVLAAFPLPLVALAALGWFRLARKWVEWCLGLISVAGLIAFGMINFVAEPHPRLVFFAYPALAVLAGQGAVNLYEAGRLLLRPASAYVHPKLALGVSLVAPLAWLVVCAWPGNASLFGNWTYEYRFHVLGLF
jgi:hypothetical protein